VNLLSFYSKTKNLPVGGKNVVYAYTKDSYTIASTTSRFGAILVDGNRVLEDPEEFIKGLQAVYIPIIALFDEQVSYKNLRKVLNYGASDFSVAPFEDLEEVIDCNAAKFAAIKASSEKEFDRLRKSLSNAIPHEFNTPLTAIIGLSSMMLKTPDFDKETIKDFSGNILKAANRLSRLIDNYLFYSHLQIKLSSDSQIQRARTFFIENPDQVIMQVVHDLWDVGKRKIVYDVEKGVVQCNETNFYKLIYYLLDNALKFSGEDDKVEVAARNENNRYLITINNEGSGMDDAQVQMIGAYRQFERNINEQQGLGLGLAIVHSILKLYNGQININSQKDEFVKINLQLETKTSLLGVSA